MQVVYSPSHLAHDITHETYMGVLVPANDQQDDREDEHSQDLRADADVVDERQQADAEGVDDGRADEGDEGPEHEVVEERQWARR